MPLIDDALGKLLGEGTESKLREGSMNFGREDEGIESGSVEGDIEGLDELDGNGGGFS